MKKSKSIISAGAILALSFTGISGCSVFGKVGKTARNMTGGQQSSNTVAVDEKLIIPPSLKAPGTAPARQPVARSSANTKRPSQISKATYKSNKNYYVVVGTYPSQEQALDTFARLSSIGLPGATMESRATKGGKVLHMVRLGPYQKQEDIDKVKDNLTSDGLSQFKVVEN